MAQAYLILNANKRMVAAHSWGGEVIDQGHCPVTPPQGGAIMEVTKAGANELIALMAGGQIVTVEDNRVSVDGEPIGKLRDGELVLE